MEARFCSLLYQPNTKFLMLDETGRKHKNEIGRTSSGQTLYWVKETRLMMILVIPGAKPKRVDANVYNEIKTMYPYRNITKKFINTLNQRFYNLRFDVDENGKITNFFQVVEQAGLFKPTINTEHDSTE